MTSKIPTMAPRGGPCIILASLAGLAAGAIVHGRPFSLFSVFSEPSVVKDLTHLHAVRSPKPGATQRSFVPDLNPNLALDPVRNRILTLNLNLSLNPLRAPRCRHRPVREKRE